DLTDHLVGVVDLQGAGRQERGQLGGVGEPFVYDVDDVVLLDGVQDLDEAGVAQQGGGACRGQDGAGPCVVRGQDVHPDGAAELLVHGTPTAESVQTGDALLEAVASGQLVTAVQFGRRGLPGTVGPGVLLCLVAVRVLLPVLGHPVGRGLVRLCGQRLLAAVVCHVDGSCAPIRHRRSLPPHSLRVGRRPSRASDAETNCAHSPPLCTTHGGGRWLCAYPPHQRPRRPRTIPTNELSSSMRIRRAATKKTPSRTAPPTRMAAKDPATPWPIVWLMP